MKPMLTLLGGCILILAAGSHAGGQDTIFGCYAQKNGNLRIVADHSECRSSELPISWPGALNDVTGDLNVTGTLTAADIVVADSTVITVRPDESGVPAASGDRLRGALTGITDASSTKPYLVRLEPGLYDVGVTSLAMLPYVDIEGSGRDNTVVTGTPAGDGVVRGAAHTQLRHLKVVNTSTNGAIALYYNDADGAEVIDVIAEATGTGASGTTNVGILANNCSLMEVTDVRALASGGGANNVGIRLDATLEIFNLGSYTFRNVESDALIAPGDVIGIDVGNDGSVTMMHVEASANIFLGSATNVYGIVSRGQDLVIMRDITATGNGLNAVSRVGISMQGVTVPLWLWNSEIYGADTAIESDENVTVANSRLGNGVTGAGTFKCANTLDWNYDPLDVFCQ